VIELIKQNPTLNNVHYLTPYQEHFEKQYLEIREKEKRIYSDREVDELPFVEKGDLHYDEWKKRTKSFQLLRNYIERNLFDQATILDLGCGNGWLLNRINSKNKYNCIGLDRNKIELEQAARITHSQSNTVITYGDIFTSSLTLDSLDIIIINSAIQYFESIQALLTRLFLLLKTNGVIHILDSPIYTSQQANYAKKRTQTYYQNLGIIEPVNYHHHTWDSFDLYQYSIKHNPQNITNRIKNLLFQNNPIFPWLIIKK